MRFSLVQDLPSGQGAVVAEPEEYDGVPPVDRLLFDRRLVSPNADVLALSAFLAFAPYCSGRITFPRAVSPELAEAIEIYCDPVWAQSGPVDLAPRAAPKGDGCALLAVSHVDGASLDNAWGEPRNATIRVLDSSRWSGSLVALDEVFVGSNAHSLAKIWPPTSRTLPLISVALLYMEPLRCNTLIVPDSMVVDEILWSKLAGLMRACKLRLVRRNVSLN